MHCGRFIDPPLTRRAMLRQCANGFGMVALAAMWAEQSAASSIGRDPLAPRPPHFPPSARNVIFLYMDGGPSQVDTFDYTPLLEKYHGRDTHSVFKGEPTQ